MQLNQLKPKTKSKKKKLVGRGGKRGTYSGRGLKGQKARAGRKMRPEMRDIIKKIPKKRGYRSPFLKKKIFAINLLAIEKIFNSGERITKETLFEKGLVCKAGGKIPEIKILGNGDISKKLDFSGMKISRPAKEKIKKAGGKIK